MRGTKLGRDTKKFRKRVNSVGIWLQKSRGNQKQSEPI